MRHTYMYTHKNMKHNPVPITIFHLFIIYIQHIPAAINQLQLSTICYLKFMTASPSNMQVFAPFSSASVSCTGAHTHKHTHTHTHTPTQSFMHRHTHINNIQPIGGNRHQSDLTGSLTKFSAPCKACTANQYIPM